MDHQTNLLKVVTCTIAAFFIINIHPVRPANNEAYAENKKNFRNNYLATEREWIDVTGNMQNDIINACEFLSPDDGWAVGKDEILEEYGIWHWNGREWEKYKELSYTTSLPAPINDIEFITPTDGWMVGDLGFIAHWDGEKWEELPKINYDDYMTLSFASGDFGFVAGEYNETKPYHRSLLLWDGISFQETSLPLTSYSQPDTSINKIFLDSENNGWASSRDDLYQWNGTNWQLDPHKPEMSPDMVLFYDFEEVGTDLYAAGAVFRSYDDRDGLILSWDFQSSRWKITYQQSPYSLFSLKMYSQNLGWAVGVFRGQEFDFDKKKGILLEWDGKNWIENSIPTNSPLYTICGFDPAHTWAFGYDFVNDYDAKSVILRLIEKVVPATQTPSAVITPTVLTTEEAPTLSPTVTPEIVETIDSQATPSPRQSNRITTIAIILGVLLAIAGAIGVVKGWRR